MEGDLSLSTNELDSPSLESPGVLQGDGSSCGTNVAEPGLVHDFDLQSQAQAHSSQSETLPDSWHQSFLVRVKEPGKPSLLGFVTEVYSKLYSSETAGVLVRAIRGSTSRQYETVWAAFCSFVKARNVTVVNTELVLAFFRYLFFERKLAPATVSAYKSALVRPLRLAFGVDVTLPPFNDFIRALYNIRPSRPPGKVSWSLEKVLSLALSDRFQNNPSVEDSLMLCVFLMCLATGGRISEIHALLRTEDYVVFSESGVSLYFNPNFLAKNEHPGSRRGPIFISVLNEEDGAPHPLCPVNNLRKFLNMTSSTTSIKLFVNPIDLSDLSIFKLRWFLCKFVRMADPGSFPKVHDLRKVATSLAFLRHVNLEEICNLTGWSSIRVFRRHYFKEIEAVRSSLVAMGSVVPGSVRDV